MKCNILLIDSPADTTLLKEILPLISLPVNLQCTHSMAEALEIIIINPPDMILVGSCILLVEGIDTLESISKVPTVILSETDGFDKFYKDNSRRMLYITKPIDLEKIPGVIERAYEFWAACKEGNL